MQAGAIWCRRFIGRAGELEVLADARRELAKSHGSFLLIAGDAGIGKSRLVAQSLRSVTGKRGPRIVFVECVRGPEEPLWPVRAFLATFASEAQTAPPLAARAFAQLVPESLPPSFASSFAGAALGTAELFAGLAAAIAHVGAKRRAILVVEDMHWADRTTLEFFAYLVRRLATMPLMIVATYRPDDLLADEQLADIISRTLRERAVRRIELGAMPGDDIRALIDGALEDRYGIDDATRQTIVRRCEGNPFFAEEFLKDAAEKRAGDGSLPTSIVSSIRHRLARLDVTDRRILQTAAVLGYRFDPSILAHVLEAHADVTGALRRARDANIMAEESASVIRFRHELTRRAIYDGVLKTEARSLHRRILALYEAMPAAEVALADLAYHAWEAQDDARSVDYNERAGEAALALGAPAQAQICFERALAGAPDDESRVRLLEKLSAAFRAQGILARSAEAASRALEMRLERGEYDDAGRLIVALTGDRSNAGDRVEPALEAFLRDHGERLSRGGRDAVAVFLARMYCARYAFDRAAEILAKVSPPDQLVPRVRANYYISLLNMQAGRGNRDAWRETAARGSALSISGELQPHLATILAITIAQLGVWLGGGDVVETSLAEAERSAERFGFEALQAFGAAVRAHAAYAGGDVAQARERVEAALHRPEIAVAYMVVSTVGPYVARSLGDRDLAERCLDHPAVRAAENTNGDIDGLHSLAARVASVPSDGPEAQMLAARLQASFRRLPAGTRIVPLTLVTAAERFGDKDLVHVLETCDPARFHASDQAGSAAASLVRAIVMRRRRSPESRTLALDAAARFRALHWPLFEAASLECAGDTAAAAQLYARCGATSDARRLATFASESATSRVAFTSRESAVANLIAAGASNRDISDELGISVKTVEKYVSAILAKLGVRSRAQIAAYVSRQSSATLERRIENSSD